MLSSAIHFIGRRTFDSCRKYFRWYISSVRPKSATLITPLAATLRVQNLKQFNIYFQQLTCSFLLPGLCVQTIVMQDKPCLQISVDTLTVAASEQMRLVQYHCSQPL